MSRKLRKGERFKRWTVIGDAAPHVHSDGVGRARYERPRVRVECVCGERAVVEVRDLLRGRTTGCRSQKCRDDWRVHGMVELALSELRARVFEEADERAFDLAQDWIRSITLLAARDPAAPPALELVRAAVDLERRRGRRRRSRAERAEDQMQLVLFEGGADAC